MFETRNKRAVMGPTIRKSGDSFSLTFWFEPILWSTQVVVGLCLVIFGFSSLKGFGGAVAIIGVSLLLVRPWRVRFEAAARRLTVEKGWCLLKKTYDMNLLKRYYIKSVHRSGPYCVLVLDVSGKMEDAGFGPFRSDGEIRRLMDLLGASLGRSVPEARANGAPY